jgi:putative copper export protein
MEALLATFQQWTLLAGFVVVMGCVAWRVAVAPGAARLLPADRAPALGSIERRVAVAGTIAGLVLIGAWLLRMVVQVRGFRDPFVPLREDVTFLLFETFWGTVWMAQGPIVALLTLALWRAGAASSARSESVPPRWRSPDWAWRAAAVLALGLAATLALSSHAMGVDSWRPLIVTMDALHAVTAGSWIGALGLILAVGRHAGGIPPGPGLFAAQIRGFSDLARVSVALLLTTGVVLAWTHLSAVSDLWATTYGRILAAKIGLAAAVFAAGFVNWRRGVPVVETEAGARSMKRRAAWEVALAAGVLLLTSVLVHSPKP